MSIDYISPQPQLRKRKLTPPNSRCTVGQRRQIDLACQTSRITPQAILGYARFRFEIGVLKPLRGLQDLTYQQANRLLRDIKSGAITP